MLVSEEWKRDLGLNSQWEERFKGHVLDVCPNINTQFHVVAWGGGNKNELKRTHATRCSFINLRPQVFALWNGEVAIRVTSVVSFFFFKTVGLQQYLLHVYKEIIK
jgi:hypothetical protein